MGAHHALRATCQAVQGPRRICRQLEARRGFGLRERAQPRLEALWHGHAWLQRRQAAVALLRLHVVRECPAARHQRVATAPEAVQVGPGPVVPPSTQELLGRHVRRGSPAEGVAGGSHGVGDPEVRELDLARRGGVEHVRQLQVAVDHPAGVCVGQGIQQAGEDPLDLGPAQGAHVVRQGGALHELHRQVGRARHQAAPARLCGLLRHGPVVQHHRDVGMLEGSDRAHLVAERLHEHRPRGPLGGEHLHRHAHTLREVARTPHLAHAAPANPRLEHERAESNPPLIVTRASAHGQECVPPPPVSQRELPHGSRGGRTCGARGGIPDPTTGSTRLAPDGAHPDHTSLTTRIRAAG